MTRLEKHRQHGTVEELQNETHGRVFAALKNRVGQVFNAGGKTVHITAHGISQFIRGLFGH